jgi:hypothetical protein
MMILALILAQFMTRPDMRLWQPVEYSGSALAPYEHFWDRVLPEPMGHITYRFPADLIEYGVPGCQAWDMSSMDERGPVWFEHVLQTDYIVMRAPSGHLIRWTCRGLKKIKEKP